MSHVKCLVEECKYHNNNVCQASSIEVRSSGDATSVSNSDNTACSTFIPENLSN